MRDDSAMSPFDLIAHYHLDSDIPQPYTFGEVGYEYPRSTAARDRLINNFLRMFFATRWMTWQASGLSATAKARSYGLQGMLVMCISVARIVGQSALTSRNGEILQCSGGMIVS